MKNLNRVASELVLGPSQRLESRRHGTSFDELGEIDQQFQVNASGLAAPTLAWSNIELQFDVEFVNAVNQRYSNLTVPQFTHGYEAFDAVPVLVSAVVVAWAIDNRDVISGATIAIGCVAPGAVETVAFSGAVHLTFQGFGAVAEFSSGEG